MMFQSLTIRVEHGSLLLLDTRSLPQALVESDALTFGLARRGLCPKLVPVAVELVDFEPRNRDGPKAPVSRMVLEVHAVVRGTDGDELTRHFGGQLGVGEAPAVRAAR